MVVVRRQKHGEARDLAEESTWSDEAQSFSKVRSVFVLAIDLLDLSLKSWDDLRAQVIKQRPNFQMVAEEMTVCVCFI